MKKSDIFFESERNLRKTGILDTVLEDYPLELCIISVPIILFIAAVILNIQSKTKLAINIGVVGFITLIGSSLLILILRLL